MFTPLYAARWKFAIYIFIFETFLFNTIQPAHISKGEWVLIMGWFITSYTRTERLQSVN